jgi:hypothetical protein
MTEHFKRCRRGLTLVEIVTSFAILGAVAVTAIQGIRAVQSSQLDAADMMRADLLARDLMAEILTQPFSVDDGMASPGTTNRSLFNEVGDYQGWNADHSRAPQRKDGTVIESAAGWYREVQVSQWGSVATDQVLQVTVIAGRNGVDLAEYTVLRTRHSRTATTLQ